MVSLTALRKRKFSVIQVQLKEAWTRVWQGRWETRKIKRELIGLINGVFKDDSGFWLVL